MLVILSSDLTTGACVIELLIIGSRGKKLLSSFAIRKELN